MLKLLKIPNPVFAFVTTGSCVESCVKSFEQTGTIYGVVSLDT